MIELKTKANPRSLDSYRDQNKSRRFNTQVHKTKYTLETPGMKELLHQFAVYNAWANQKLLDMILMLPEEKQRTIAKTSKTK